jgi:hypothetical protein
MTDVRPKTICADRHVFGQIACHRTMCTSEVSRWTPYRYEDVSIGGNDE